MGYSSLKVIENGSIRQIGGFLRFPICIL